MIDSKEKYLVSLAMRRYGGGFVSRLGEALIRADANNTQRIHDAFPEYWEKYLQLAKDRGLDKEED